MPRDPGTGVYTKPFPDVVTATTISSTVHNGTINDLVTDANTKRPIVAGGTNATTVTEARFNLIAEAAAQLVTNFDTHIWLPGSFYCSSAPGQNQPVASHAFAGVAIIAEPLANPPTNANVVVMARDLDDASTPGIVWVREKKANVWGSWTRDTANILSPLTINGDANGDATINLNKTASTDLALLFGQTNGLNRWLVSLGDATAESGSNVGSDFGVARYNDAGALLDSPLFIKRSTGNATFLKNVLLGTLAMPLSDTPALLAPQHFVQKSGNIAFNATLISGTWKATETGYAANIWLDNSTGALNFQNLTASASAGATASFSTPLQIAANGNATFSAALTATGALTANSASITTSATIGSTLGVTGAATLQSTLTVGNGGTTGQIFLGNTGTRFLQFDGSNLNVSNVGTTVFNGNVNINKANPTLALLKTAASGQDAIIYGYGSNGQPRWAIDIANAVNEAGANAGSDFSITRYNDAGAAIAVPFQINRSTGVAFFESTVNCAIAAPIGSGGVQVQSFYGGGSPYIVNMILGNPNYSQCTYTLQHFSGVYVAHRWDINGQGYEFRQDGNAAKPGGGSFIAISDARTKNVLGNYNSGLDAIASLRPVYYTYKGNDTPGPPSHYPDATSEEEKAKNPHYGELKAPYANSPHQKMAEEQTQLIGLVAQEVEVMMPEMVLKRKGFIDGVPVTDFRELDPGPLIFALINAVKELKTRVEELERQG